MITISKSKLIKGSFVDSTGQRCIVGEVLHQYGVDNSTLRDNSYNWMWEKVTDPNVRDAIFHITGHGHYSLTPSIMTATMANDEGEYDRAAAILTRVGIEVELVD